MGAARGARDKYEVCQQKKIFLSHFAAPRAPNWFPTIGITYNHIYQYFTVIVLSNVVFLLVGCRGGSSARRLQNPPLLLSTRGQHIPEEQQSRKKNPSMKRGTNV